MSYKFTRGTVDRGDIYNEDDAQQNTYLDWSEDAVGFVCGGHTCLVISGSGAVSSSLNLSASAFYGDGSHLENVTATASPAGSAGQVQFNNGGSSTGGASRMYWDETNRRLGIGTASPYYSLHVSGGHDAIAGMFVGELYVTGNSAKLVVEETQGSDYRVVIDPNNGPLIQFGNDVANHAYMTIGAYSSLNNIDTETRDFHLYGSTTTTGFYFDESLGRFGLGTSTPSKDLDIEGADQAIIQLTATNYRSYNIGSDGYGFVIHDATTGGTDGYRLVISDQADALGYVGIGAGGSLAASAHPQALLHLSSSDDAAIFRADTTDGKPVLFATGSKRVGIGTHDPSSRLHVYGNVSSNYLTLIDNDASSAAHALKVTTDGNGAGTYVLDLESQSTTLFRVRGDGRVGIGKVTSLPSACLTVSGSTHGDADIAIASKIQHIGDSDTYISFEDDEIVLYAGGRGFIKCQEDSTDKLMLNYGALDIDLQVKGENEANLIRTDAANDRVGIATASPSSTFAITGSFARAITTITGTSNSIGVTHSTVLLDASAGNCSAQLPTAVGATGRLYTFKRTDNSANSAKVQTNGSETIDGATDDYGFDTQYNVLTIQSDGSNWWIINEVHMGH